VALADDFAVAFCFFGFAAGPVAAFQNSPAANAPASGATQKTEMCCMRLWPCIQTLCVTQVYLPFFMLARYKTEREMALIRVSAAHKELIFFAPAS